jgi:hypothetical protein
LSSIENFVSNFIEQQFPSFYRDNGPNFIAFVRSYYEWLEQRNNTLGHSRRLLEYSDIDNTDEQFLKHFKYQFIQSLPEDTVADKRLLIKHILDLYRSKGTPRAVELLFRMVFNEDIELYIPGEFVFKPSDNTWKIPRYLEVTSNDNLIKLLNTKIVNVENTASAVVDNINSLVISGKIVNILEVSQLTGEFKVSDTLIQPSVPIAEQLGVRVVGSLDSVIVTSGGSNYRVGDILDVEGSDVPGQVKVTQTSNNFIGALAFNIVDGGSGYTTNATVTILPTLNFDITNLLGTIEKDDVIVNSTNTASGTVFFSNSSAIQLINFSDPSLFFVGDTISGPSGNATLTRLFGGTGSNANFSVGSLSNREIITYYTTLFNDYLTLELDSPIESFRIELDTPSGTFGVGDEVTSTANSVLLEGTIVSSGDILVGEELANSALGISGLYVYRSDINLMYCTGADSDLTNANLVSGVILQSNTSGTEFSISTPFPKQTVSGNGIISIANSSSITLDSVLGYFVQSATITSNSGGSAVISSVERLTDWELEDSNSPVDNLDSILQDSLATEVVEVGTIASLTGINPGVEYFTRPVVRVTQENITAQLIADGFGGLKGNNAIISATAIGGNGTIITVEVTNSGYLYNDNQPVILRSSTNPTIVRGNVVLSGLGRSEGKWLNRKSFLSDVMKIHDNNFYQDYSYQVIAQRMLSSYEKLVRDFVHPSGLALFGAFKLDKVVQDDPDLILEATISQAV